MKSQVLWHAIHSDISQMLFTVIVSSPVFVNDLDGEFRIIISG